VAVSSLVAPDAQDTGPLFGADEGKKRTRQAENGVAVRMKLPSNDRSASGAGLHGLDRKRCEEHISC